MAQSGRASALGAEGRKFKSYYSDQFLYHGVIQMRFPAARNLFPRNRQLKP